MRTASPDFDAAVAALRGKVSPRAIGRVNGTRRLKTKAESTPEEWAAALDYHAARRDANADAIRRRARDKYHADPEAAREKARRKYAANRDASLMRTKRYREANRNKANAATERWRERNRERVRKASLDWYHANRERAKATSREWRKANGDRFRALMADWRQRNRDHVREYSAELHRKRYASDVQYRLAVLLRTRLGKAIVNGQKSGSAIRDLGCSIDKLARHIEEHFAPGMTWGNWGHTGRAWHLDHVYPLACADLTNPAERRAVCNYRNLRPVWSSRNIRKSDTVTPTARRLFRRLVRSFGG